MKKFLSSNKSFGFLILSILIIIQIIFYKFNFSIILPIIILVLLLTIIKPEIFTYPKKLWIRFGLFLGKFINPIVCFFLYYVVVGLTKISLDLFKKKLIQKKADPNTQTYWRLRNDKTYKNFDNQF